VSIKSDQQTRKIVETHVTWMKALVGLKSTMLRAELNAYYARLYGLK
jgi:hypothetical protein